MRDTGALKDSVAMTAPQVQAATLQRKIDWTGAFWVASGVPALVLFSVGAVAVKKERQSWLVWMISIGFGFIQAFTYAEIAGLFPHKSGGASVYGAIAWVRYGKFIAPVSVWCNWLAWSPVLAIGSGLAAGYVLSACFAPDAAINTWHIRLLDLGAVKPGLFLRIDATFVIGAILTGDMTRSHFFPIVPLTHDAQARVIDGQWNAAGWTLMAGGLFIAAWSTYAFETSVCYTREFKDPHRDTFKAIFYSGLLCIAIFTLVPLAFQGHLGLGELVTPAVLDRDGKVLTPAVYDGMLSPSIYSGMGVGDVMARMVGGGAPVERIIVVMLILAVVLSIMTAMAGSSRTLYQASVDGWLPRYLAHVNSHGAPTRAMWTDL